ncbi:hypothetical protein AAMO2058_001469300 [Amorphochlora amoebiformis]
MAPEGPPAPTATPPLRKLCYGEKEYWNERYAKSGMKKFEWYGPYETFRSQVLNSLESKSISSDEKNTNILTKADKMRNISKTETAPETKSISETDTAQENNTETTPGLAEKRQRAKLRVLIIGCGNSGLSEGLYQDGFTDSVSIDISDVVINQMQKYYKGSIPLHFEVMDARELKFKANEFDLIFDKGTIDSILCGEGSTRNAGQMLRNIHKVLKPSGRFFLITCGTPEARMIYLTKRVYKWDVKHSKIGNRHLYIATKKSA